MIEFPGSAKEIILTTSLLRRPWFIAEPRDWIPHAPFAYWLIDTLRPSTFVELGSLSGNSYFAFCQGIQQSQIKCQAYAVDTWEGDLNAAFSDERIYARVVGINDSHFSSFSKLVRSKFCDAVSSFKDRSIDLLHIDGCHSFDALRKDFEAWLPKMSPRGVVLLHGINVDERSFAIGSFWEKLAALYPSLSFSHGHGLGVLLVGETPHPTLLRICEAARNTEFLESLRGTFGGIGGLLVQPRDSDGLPEIRQLACLEDPSRDGQTILNEAQDSTTLRILLREASKKLTTLDKRLKGAVFLNQYLSTQLQQHSLWTANFSERLEMMRQSGSWRAMRALRRFLALVIRREGEGPRGFLRWGAKTLLGRRTAGSSYDPFEGVDSLPEAPKEFDWYSSSSTAQAPAESRGSKDMATGISDPVLLREGSNSKNSVDCVIPLKGSIHWLSQCLQFLITPTAKPLLNKVIVVDDGSTEDEIALVQQLIAPYPEITFAKNIAPHGFGAACNTGAALCTAPHILFLNSDCLVSPNTIESMVAACCDDSAVGLVTALSNNAATLSVAMRPGMSFVEMSEVLAAQCRSASIRPRYVEACTVAGHCLLVTKRCFTAVGGFDLSWGLGYGEETDLQMRARKVGYRGVAVLDTYVYHFGGGTFKYEQHRVQFQKTNHARFLKLWGEDYRKLSQECAAKDPVVIANHLLDKGCSDQFSPEVLFVLPGLTHSVGGILATVDICNFLVKEGVDAKILLLGRNNPEVLRDFPEALYTRPLEVRREEDLLALESTLRPKIIVATLFTTVMPAIRLALATQATFINFVQGYEFYFDQGIHYGQVRDTYQASERVLTTSAWLAEGVARHNPSAETYLLPLGIDEYSHFPSVSRKMISNKRMRLAVVLRHAPDKGQWMAQEVIERLAKHVDQIALTVFHLAETKLALHPNWAKDSMTHCIKLPLDRYQMASELRNCDVLLDCSLHEGFGLIPLEMFANGGTVVASASGGVGQFLQDRVNGMLVQNVTDPEAYLERVLELTRNRPLLERLREAAVLTAQHFTASLRYKEYLVFFSSLLKGDEKSIEPLRFQGLESPSALIAAQADREAV